jgi:hypothetical protein
MRNQKREKSADGRHGYVCEDQKRPFHGFEHRVQDDVDEQNRERQYDQ